LAVSSGAARDHSQPPEAFPWNCGACTFWAGLIDDVRIYDHVLTAEEIAALAQ